MKDDRVYLQHILRCISRIEGYTEGGREAFFSSSLVQDAAIRNLQTLEVGIADAPQRWPVLIRPRVAGFDRPLTPFGPILLESGWPDGYTSYNRWRREHGDEDPEMG